MTMRGFVALQAAAATAAARRSKKRRFSLSSIGGRRTTSTNPEDFAIRGARRGSMSSSATQMCVLLFADR
jgi:hypothetical protein